jgi:hypothetical protein
MSKEIQTNQRRKKIVYSWYTNKNKLEIQIDLEKKKGSKQSITVLTFYWSQFIKKIFTLVENYKKIENSNK